MDPPDRANGSPLRRRGWSTAPLELSYRWQAPVVVSTVSLVVLVGLLVRSRAPGWLAAAAVLVALWLAFAAVVWIRTRAYLAVEDDVLVIRRFRALHRIDGASVRRVSEVLTPHGPSYALWVDGDDGRRHRCLAPVALLVAGHSTLFRWILRSAPAAELDKGARRTVDRLRSQGALP